MARVKLFGAIGDVAGWSERSVAGATFGALKTAIAEGDERLASLLAAPTTLVIIDNALTPHSLRADDRPLAPDEEIAFGSPVSGG